LFPDRADFADYARLEHRLHRRHDPERQRGIRHAVERLAHSPDEVAEAMRAVEQLASQGTDIRPSDVGSLLGVIRSGGDPAQALEEGESRRAERVRPVESPESEQSQYQYQETPRQRGYRAPFVGREARTEAAIMGAENETCKFSDMGHNILIIIDL
jgi:hypothetical protein